MVADSGQPLEQARALAREALDSWRGADPDRAIDACDHALALLLPVGPSDALADVLRWKGSVLRDRGHHAAASDLYAQSLSVADSIGYAAGRAHALNCMGTVAQFRGDLAAAERWYAEAARFAHRLCDRRLSGMVQQNLGILADVQGRTDEAVAHFRLALAALEMEEQHDAMLWVLNNLGVIYTREGAHARAAEVLDRALALARERHDVASEGIVAENQSTLRLAMGQVDDAEERALRALRIAEQRRDNTRRAAALRVLARARWHRDSDPDRAHASLERALTLCQLGDDVLLRVEILVDLGDACRAAGDASRAREHWRRGLELARLGGFESLALSLTHRVRSAPVHRPPGEQQATLS